MNTYLLPPVDDWGDWGPIFIDVRLWRPVVERVWASDTTLQAATSISFPTLIEAGFPGTCAVFVVDGEAVIKFFPPMVARDCERERDVYRLIDLSPYQPRLLAAGAFRDRIPWPYLVFSHLSGEAWREAKPLMSREDQLEVVRELGRVIRQVHDKPLPPDGAWPAASDWPAFVESRQSRMTAELRNHTSLPDQAIREIEALLEATDWRTARPCLLHADLTEDHLLMSRQSGRWALSGLIDWADAEVGDPYYEWVALWFSICRRDVGLFRAFLAGYDPALRTEDLRTGRLLAFTVLHRFGANIINETLTGAEQRRLDSTARLLDALFPGLGG
jgi:hygromycin-B 7''-O-kinase